MPKNIISICIVTNETCNHKYVFRIQYTTYNSDLTYSTVDVAKTSMLVALNPFP